MDISKLWESDKEVREINKRLTEKEAGFISDEALILMEREQEDATADE